MSVSAKQTSKLSPWIAAALFLAAACLLIGPNAAVADEPLYPEVLLNWMVDGTFHAVIADKSEQHLGIWEIRDGEPRLLHNIPCSTGENAGDKWVRGDMKTPEGAYFFCSVIDGQRLPAKYGYWAFTTDYPNFVDKRRGKNGDGIWLHGRDKPLGSQPDSNGCIALENDDLVIASQYIRLQSTPLIIVDKLRKAKRSELIETERKIRDFIESWRQAWESQDLDAYMTHYSKNFQSCWLDYRNWKEKKRTLIKRYDRIRVRLGKVYLYRQKDLVTAIFTQSYQSESFRATGIKILYIVEKETPRIYAEDYRQLVDEPYPVAPLLARVQGHSQPTMAGKSDFRIRLVSTDEPEADVASDPEEEPRPTAPSRGVVLDKIADRPGGETMELALESNERLGGGTGTENLIVARLIPGHFPVIESKEPEDRGRPKTNEVATRPSNVAQPVDSGESSTSVRVVEKPDAGTRVASLVPSEKTESSGETTNASEKPALSSPGKAEPAKADPESRKAVKSFLQQWKSAWEQKNLDSFMKMYDASFRAGSMTAQELRKSKQRFFSKYRLIRVEVSRLEIEPVKEGYSVRFVQSFRGDDYRDKGWKSMVLAGGKDQGFRIKSEKWRPL